MINDQQDLVSVIVPTYNRAKVIHHCLNSIINQTYSNLEIIVVDDASNDHTESIVKSMDDSRIKYIRLNQNSQGTKPRNIGIESCTGKYIAFLDSDDAWLPDKIEKQLFYIKKNNEQDVLCFTGVILRWNSKEKIVINRNIQRNETIIDYIINVGWVQCGTFMCSSEIAKKTKFSSIVRKHQDWDFCFRLAKNNCKFIYLKEALTVYNIDDGNNQISTNNRFDLSLEWINSIKNEISLKSYYVFLINHVAHDMIQSNRKKEAWKIYREAFKHKSISSLVFLKGILKAMKIKWMVSGERN